MKALVTGGSGFSGTHLTRRLLADGWQVTTLDKQPGLDDEELREMGAVVTYGSITDDAAVERAVAGHDIVFHLASAFRDIHAPREVYWDIDVHGTRRVLAAAERHGVQRVVHCSTQGVHGSLEQTPGDESSPIGPLDLYCESKWHAELVCQEFLARGMDLVIVRPTSIYGPGDTHGWLKLHRMVQRGRFIMLGDGQTLNHPVYIENLVDAFVLAATVPEARGGTYLAGDARAVTLDELVRAIGENVGVDVRIVHVPLFGVAWWTAGAVERLARPFGVEPSLFRRRLNWFRTNRAFSIERARRDLGYEPRVGLAEGLARTMAWYRDRGLMGGAPAEERMAAAAGVVSALLPLGSYM